MSPSEMAACLAYALSVWLAARNSIHTWWIGIIGSGLYGWVFYSVQLYADVTLQLFFIITSITGWVHWLKGHRGEVLPVRRTRLRHFFILLACALLVAAIYGLILHRYTNAWALGGLRYFDIQRACTVYVNGATPGELVRLAGCKHAGGPVICDERSAFDRGFISGVLV